VIQQYRAIPNIFGREVTVTAGATAIGGIAEGIDLGGALLVRKTDGSVIPLRSGEVTFQDMNGPEGTTDSNQ
jgi:biotin-(acetyl-CoA carboxylase) ligase